MSNNNNSNNGNDQLVNDILAASTLYEVLGVNQKNLDKSALRKAYLTTSVKVHPDKNQHPQSTQAFQRVAEAWSTLSDDTSRAAYDAELRNPRTADYDNNNAAGGHNQGGSTYYAYDFERTHMPSFQEALFLFATATSIFAGSSCGGGGGGGGGTTSRSGSAVNAASDFVETLFWAQQLAEGRAAQTQASESNNNDSEMKNGATSTRTAARMAAEKPLQSGMALGSGLRAFADVQRAMGLRRSAAAVDKAATTVQAAALGATVLKAANENPAVRRTLERGQETLKNNPQIGKGLRASLKMAGNMVKTLHQAHQEAQQQQQQRTNSSGNGEGNSSNGNNANRFG